LALLSSLAALLSLTTRQGSAGSTARIRRAIAHLFRLVYKKAAAGTGTALAQRPNRPLAPST
jgi:hypothetical protein